MEQNGNKKNKKASTYKTKTTSLISFRLLNSDIDKLNKITKETKIKKSKILRNLIEDNPIQIIEYANDKLDSQYETILRIFNAYGNNLNQIATKLNSSKSDGKFNDYHIEILKSLCEKLDKLEKLLTENKKITTRNL